MVCYALCCVAAVPDVLQMLYLGMCGRCGEDADKFFTLKPRRRKGDRKTGELQDRCGPVVMCLEGSNRPVSPKPKANHTCTCVLQRASS
jgi:hypothetical protein